VPGDLVRLRAGDIVPSDVTLLSGPITVDQSALTGVVLIDEGLVNIVALVEQGRVIYQRILTWIINKISRTLLKAGVVTVALLVTGQFVVSPLGMILLVFLTDFAKIALATDRVQGSQ
jgi:magnesium-transporting ATPase (P-type)